MDEKSPARSRDHHHNVSGSNPSGWVWGSRRNPNNPDNNARVQRLSDGNRNWNWQDNDASTVLFRSELGAPFSILLYEFEMIFVQSALAIKNRLSIR